MYFKRSSKRDADGLTIPQDDLDEFDRLLVYCSILQMGVEAKDSDILNYDQIKEVFLKRASRHEFPASSYLAYL